MAMRNTLVRSAGAAGIALMALAGPALADGTNGAAPAAAEEGRKFGYTWTVTGASDYIFRGISYTGEDPTVNSYLELTWGIAYLGFWTSNIDTGKKYLGPWEQDIYLGIRPVTGRVNWDISALWYVYGNKASNEAGTEGYEFYGAGHGSIWDTDYVEFKVGATTALHTNVTVGGNVYWTPNQELASPENVSVEGTIAITLPAVRNITPTISGLIGYTSADDNKFYVDEPTNQSGYWAGVMDYTYWNAGLKLAIEKWSFDMRYWDTDIPFDAFSGPNADERFVFTAAVTLP